MRLMNEMLELLPVPAERDMPFGSFEARKAQLLDLVEHDLRTAGRRAGRLGRLRSLRVWLTSLGVITALIAGLGFDRASDSHSPLGTRTVTEATVAVASGSAVVSVLVGARPRSGGVPRAIMQRRALA
jgi:uncharacterized protein (DUF3820 family)